MLLLSRILIPAGALLCLFPSISSAAALVLGILLALTVGNPYLEWTSKLTRRLLSLSVIGLGAGMNLDVIGRVGLRGVGYTAIGIGATLSLGVLFGRLLKTGRDVSLLITAGTAICGGSAIAAVAPTIRARSHDVSIALATVFLLNAVALVIFPGIGHALALDQSQFGLWSALAIHDTSSVVGATMQYGSRALEIGTTVKLARALWIVPVTLLMGALYARGGRAAVGKVRRPWFILGFVIAAALVTWVPALRPAGHIVETVARRTLVVTLFLIGANLTRAALKATGLRPLGLGILLWLISATVSLAAIRAGWISLGF